MKSNYEATLAAVRAIAEGKSKPRPLRTIPVQTLVLIPCPVERPIIPLAKATCERRRPLGQLTISDAMDLFRQSNPGEFTARQCADFLMAAGWNGGTKPINCVGIKLRALSLANEGGVTEVRREHSGINGLRIIWAFTT